MAVNPYTRHTDNTNEQRLVADLVAETIKIHGIDCYYLVRQDADIDYLFGEDPNSFFNNYEILEMYVETVAGFEGDGDVLSKFGLEIKDSATLVVSKERFQHTVTRNNADVLRPREGDLIFIPFNKGFFEIKFVEHEAPFYQLGSNYVYKLNVELFRYSHENIDTGIDAIDDVVENNENDDSVANDPFAENTEIQSEADAVVDWTESSPFGET